MDKMKKTFLMLLTGLAGMMPAHADDGVSISAVTVPQGGSGTVSIELNNDSHTFTAFTFKLALPEGLSFELNAAGKPRSEKGTRFDESHTLSSGLTGGVGSFGCISTEKAPFSGTGGVLLSIPVTASTDLAVGTTLTATLSEITFTTTDVQEVLFDDVTFTVTVAEPAGPTVLDETSAVAPEASDGEVDILVKRTVKANDWGTIVLPFDMTGAQTRAAFGDDVQLAEFTGYEVEYDEEDNVSGLTVNFTETDLAEGFYANYPYLIRTSRDIAEFQVKAAIDPDAEGAVAEYDNGKKGKQRVVYGTLQGTYHAGDFVPANSLFLSGNHFYYSAGITRIKAFRAYFTFEDVLASVESSSAKIRFSVSEAGEKEEVTGLGGRAAESSGTGVFTLQGVSLGGKTVDELPKGVYVVDGKKVVK